MLPSLIVSCPKCNEQVTLPVGVGHNAKVRCPLCRAEYTLELVYEDLPPMVEVLDVPTLTPAEDVLASESYMENDDPTPASSTRPINEAGLAFMADLMNKVRESKEGEEKSEAESSTEEEFSCGTPEINARFEKEQAEQAKESEDKPFAGFGGEDADKGDDAPPQFSSFDAATGGDGSTSSRSRNRPQRPKKSPVAELIKIVLAGVVACPIALLIIWHGLHKDPLEWAPKLPSWAAFLAPADLRNAKPAGTTKKKTAAEKAAEKAAKEAEAQRESDANSRSLGDAFNENLQQSKQEAGQSEEN